VKLVNTSIDQSALQQDLVNALASSDTFRGGYPGETGRILCQIATSIASLLLYRIDSATQNNFLVTAFAQSSAYADAASLGVNPRGKTPAQVVVRMTAATNNTASMTLPVFSTFTSRGTTWYTRDAYQITPSSSYLDVTLYQGSPGTATFTANGQNYQRYVVGANYQVADGSIAVSVDNMPWSIEPTGSLILAGSSNSCIIKTMPTGEVMVLFGNGISGRVPDSGSVITISYYLTDGWKYNTSVIGDQFNPTVNFPVVFTSIASITGTSGGEDEEDLDYLKITSPRLYAAQQQAARRQDHLGWLLKYPGVVSARVWGEYEEALEKGYADVTMMNRAYFSVLLGNISTTSNVSLGTAVQNISSYSLALTSGLSIIPGSLEIDVSNDTFYDSKGQGFLFSDTSTPNIATGGTGTATSVAAGSSAAYAWNNLNESIYFSSAVKPSISAPITLTYAFVSSSSPAAIRLQSIASDIPDTRAAASLIQVYTTGSSAPFGSGTNWVKQGYYIYLPDTGRIRYTPWIPLTTPLAGMTVCTGLRIDILGSYGSANTVNVQNIQVADISALGTIDYTVNAISLKVPTSYFGSITATYVAPNLSSEQIADITSYLAAKTMFTTQFSYRSAVMSSVDIEADTYLLPSADPTNSINLMTSSLTNLFTLTPSSLGRPVFRSDIYGTILSTKGVDYCDIKNPVYDIMPMRNEFQFLENVSISTYLTSRSIGAA